MYLFSIWILFILFVVNKVNSEELSCQSAKKCGDCIGVATQRCIWCADSKKIYDDGARCQPESFLSENPTWCEGYINNPNSSVNYIKNDDFRPGSATVNAVQLKPQKVAIKVRPGVPVTFPVAFKPSKDYPLDVYYLMDFSYTMAPHLQKLKEQCDNIYRHLTKFTNNVQLGMGSFIDKPAFPYADIAKHNAYIFKNNQPITDGLVFANNIKAITYDNTANYDDPEAILDALMQAMVCKDVQWREKSRRIIVASTDGTYHSAGDGKMVGAVIPHDMECHYDTNSSLLYDYPSVSQINKVASETNTLIIFAVLKNVINEYKALSSQLFSSKSVELSTDTDIVDLIEKAYLESSNHLKLFYKLPENVKNILVQFDPACDQDKNADCNVEHKGDVKVQVTLTVTSCSPPRKVMLGVGSLSENVEIDVDVDCKCDCEKPGQGTPNSPNCNNAGLEQCSVCTQCNDGRYGTFCQCNGTDTSKTDLYKCMGKNTEVCNSRGECVCGTCICNPGYHGGFCEFDGQECPNRDGKQCSGHGDCRFAKCNCHVGWSSKEDRGDCNCTSDTSKCKVSSTALDCSGNGYCECGQCVCNASSGNVTFAGAFCECADKSCEQLGEYALCNFENRENQTICDDKHNEHADIEFSNRTQLESLEWMSAKFCRKELSDGSFIVFRSHCWSKDRIMKLHLIIQDEKDVPPKASIWIPVGATIGSILLIGLLTIIAWKILVDIYDAREYQKFEKESKDAGFDVGVNPHYREPQVNFSNPAYNGASN